MTETRLPIGIYKVMTKPINVSISRSILIKVYTKISCFLSIVYYVKKLQLINKIVKCNIYKMFQTFINAGYLI